MPKMAAFNARDLIQDGSQVCIVLDDQQYFLRITRAGKLILTK
ncbi:MAG: hemin uptake protein HemP [Pseudomonadota bacterium]